MVPDGLQQRPHEAPGEEVGGGGEGPQVRDHARIEQILCGSDREIKV